MNQGSLMVLTRALIFLAALGGIVTGCGDTEASDMAGDEAPSALTNDATAQATSDTPEPPRSDAIGELDTSAAGDDESALGPPVDQVEVAVEGFYPEGIHVDDDGAVYLGSVASGALARAGQGETEAEVIIQAGALGGGLTGIHRLDGTLWACRNSDSDGDGQVDSPSIIAIDEERGSVAYTLPLEGGVFCNDFAADAVGNVYITESVFSRIYRLPIGGTALEVWFDGPAFDPPAGGFGFNGVVVEASGAGLLVGDFATGRLAHISIAEDGSASGATWLEVMPPLAEGLPGIDGLAYSGDTLYAVRGPDVVALAVDLEQSSAQATTLDSPSPLAGPTTVAVGPGGDIWVAEGQLNLLFDGDPETNGALPFRAVRIPAP